MKYKPAFMLKNFLKIGLILLVTVFSLVAKANDSTPEKFNPGELILHHVGDSHEWEFAHGLVLPLPIIIFNTEANNGKTFEIFSSANFDKGTHGAEVEKHENGTDEDIELKLHPSAETHAPASAIYNGYYLDNHNVLHAENGHNFYDISITKNVASLLLSAVLLIVVFIGVAGSYKRKPNSVPKGLGAIMEPIILFVRDDVARPSIGKKADKYLPYLLTIFFFIWFNNLLGLLPGGANVTGNIAVTIVLALLTFIITTFSGNKSYWRHIYWTPGVPWWLKTLLPVMPIVEFIGIFTKPFSLMIRLFANITAGHIIILSLLSLIFMFESYAVGLASTAFAVAMNFLELFVAILQAYVFTLLTAIYIGSALEDHAHEEHHAAEVAH